MVKIKRSFIITLMLGVILLLGGCTTDENSNNSSNNTSQNKGEVAEEKFFWEENLPENTVALILNEYTEKQYESFDHIEKIDLDDFNEKMILVSAKEGIDIEIWSVTYEESGLVEDELVFEKKSAPKNYALDIQCIRAEGIPSYKIKITEGDKVIDYVIAFDGKDGHESIEYLVYENQN